MIEKITHSGNRKEISDTDTSSSLRVNVGLLDTLMNLAGELVLSRNQLLQGTHSANERVTEVSIQRIDMITSELQEAIMKTRMQPIANILNKLTQIVEDLSQQHEKSIDFVMEGKDVELDKTILESIHAPLTSLIKNCVEHGIEPPDDRTKTGKSRTGKITLKAFHDAGQINIVISDDGKGFDPEEIAETAVSNGLISPQQLTGMTDKQKTELILNPDFFGTGKSTGESEKGLGLNIIVARIENIGGIIELTSVVGKSTEIQIKLPLTLAIIPSQIVSVGDEKYALPQANLQELIRIPASEVKNKIERVGNADVVRLRGELLPLLNLAGMLDIDTFYLNPGSQEMLPDRRKHISDRRSKQHDVSKTKHVLKKELEESNLPERAENDRRVHSTSAVNIAVVSAGTYKYGLVVEQLFDSEEIVVKPLGRHLKKCDAYSGATIMGDGKVALILDITKIAQMAELSLVQETTLDVKKQEHSVEENQDKVALLTFQNLEAEHLAVPISLVERIERIKTSDIEQVSGRQVVQYRGGALPLYELSQVANVGKLPEREYQEVIVFKIKNRNVGLKVTPPVNNVQTIMDVDARTLNEPAIHGSLIIGAHTTLLININELVNILNPDWMTEAVTETKKL